MKRLIIAALALMGLNAASFAQTIKKHEPSKMHAVTKAPDKKADAKVVTMQKPAKQTAPVRTKPPVAKSNVASHKKDGTPDKRYTANKHLKANGAPDMRYKANKKHS